MNCIKKMSIQAYDFDDAINRIKRIYENNKNFHKDSTLVSFSIENKLCVDRKNVLINEIISYLYEDEKKHYEEFEDKPTDHIFLKLEELSKIIN